jgi:hypothetical protein
MRPRASVAAWIIAEEIDLSEAGLERYVAGKFCTFAQPVGAVRRLDPAHC